MEEDDAALLLAYAVALLTAGGPVPGVRLQLAIEALAQAGRVNRTARAD